MKGNAGIDFLANGGVAGLLLDGDRQAGKQELRFNQSGINNGKE